MNYCFSAKQRLKSSAQFNRVFADKQRVFGRHYLAYYAKNELFPRLGVIASKRSIRRAIARNRVRRIVKEVFRLRQHELPMMDIVVVAKHTAALASKTELFQCIERLFTQLISSCRR